MKTKSLPLAIVAMFLTTVAHAQDALTAEAADASLVADTVASLTWQQSLIVVLTPLIIAGLKKLIPSVPKGVLPFLAPICGVLLEVVSHLATGSTLNPWAALALGAAGVGLREAVKQLKNATAPADA